MSAPALIGVVLLAATAAASLGTCMKPTRAALDELSADVVVVKDESRVPSLDIYAPRIIAQEIAPRAIERNTGERPRPNCNGRMALAFVVGIAFTAALIGTCGFFGR